MSASVLELLSSANAFWMTAPLKKRIFCSSLDELKCWTPVSICSKSTVCSSGKCGHPIAVGHLLIRYPTTIHYECFDKDNNDIHCLLCEEIISTSQKKMSLKICGTYGFKHFPSCLLGVRTDNGGTTSTDQSPESSPDDIDGALVTTKKRKN